MVSWNDVEEWDADGVAAVGDALVKARNAIVELEDELTDSASPEEWTGPSAESARQNLAKYRQDLETLVTEVAAMVATVDTVEDAVRQLRRDIDEAKGLAATHGFPDRRRKDPRTGGGGRGRYGVRQVGPRRAGGFHPRQGEGSGHRPRHDVGQGPRRQDQR